MSVKQKRQPLVTILIPNYNYGHYLEYCLESVLAQTYPNIEVHFSDNASTDNSYEIAQKYRKIFKEKGIYFKIADNKRNIGSDKNSKMAAKESEGEYIYTLASDDAIYPKFIETCVSIMEEHPNVGTVIVNRDEIDDHGKITPLVPFYNTNCIIDGDAQAGVYMMAGIAIPGQRMTKIAVINQIQSFMRNWNVAGDWYDNFLYACVGDVAYVKDSLMAYRVHTGNETNESERKLLGITEHYQLIHAFLDVADAYGLKKPRERYEEAVKHLGEMCPRYALKMLDNNLPAIARKYLQLALVYNEEMEQSEDWKALKYIARDDDAVRIKEEIAAFKSTRNLNRTKSYDPPEGWRPLEI